MADRDILNECASAALRSIQDNGLQVDPQSFSVWYEYHRGENTDLRRLIDIYRSNRGVLTAAAITRIYDRFIANPLDHKYLRDTAARMEQALNEILALVGEAGAQAGRFGTAVRTASGEFAAEKTSIGTLVASLLGEAREVAARAARIEGELVRNGEMIRTMQQTLQDARHAALTDPLTGLANRRHLDETLQSAAGMAMNDGRALSLLLLDIDHFKRVNDRWGHPVGDQVIKFAAAAIRASLGPSDFAARYGGEEFAVLLPAATIDVGKTVGERIRAAFANGHIIERDSGEDLGTLTVSVGAAAYEPGEKLSEWVGRTDAALYAAKAGGRNRLVTAPQPVTAR